MFSVNNFGICKALNFRGSFSLLIYKRLLTIFSCLIDFGEKGPILWVPALSQPYSRESAVFSYASSIHQGKQELNID